MYRFLMALLVLTIAMSIVPFFGVADCRQRHLRNPSAHSTILAFNCQYNPKSALLLIIATLLVVAMLQAAGRATPRRAGREQLLPPDYDGRHTALVDTLSTTAELGFSTTFDSEILEANKPGPHVDDTSDWRNEAIQGINPGVLEDLQSRMARIKKSLKDFEQTLRNAEG